MGLRQDDETDSVFEAWAANGEGRDSPDDIIMHKGVHYEMSVRNTFISFGVAGAAKRMLQRSLSEPSLNERDEELLYHLATERPEAPTPTPRASSVQADKRFQEMVAYIKENKPEMSRCLSAYKARNNDSTGLLYSASPVTV
eukprot:s1378_g7.t1